MERIRWSWWKRIRCGQGKARWFFGANPLAGELEQVVEWVVPGTLAINVSIHVKLQCNSAMLANWTLAKDSTKHGR